jgi:hypothetical protein
MHVDEVFTKEVHFPTYDKSALVRINAHHHFNPAYTINHHDVQSTGFVVSSNGEQRIVTTAHSIEELQLPPASLNLDVDYSISYDAMGMATYPNDPEKWAKTNDGETYVSPQNDVTISVTNGRGMIYLYVSTAITNAAHTLTNAYSIVEPLGIWTWTDTRINHVTGYAYVSPGEVDLNTASSKGSSKKALTHPERLSIIDLNLIANEGKTPEITKFAALTWDKDNTACRDILSPVWDAAPGGIADIYEDADGNIVNGTLQDALDFMDGKPILDAVHSFRVHSDAGLLLFTGTTWYGKVRDSDKHKLDNLPVPIALMQQRGCCGYSNSAYPNSTPRVKPTGLAFDISANCTNHGEPCALNPKFLGVMGAGLQIPARPASEIPGSPGGSIITLDQFGGVDLRNINTNYTATGWPDTSQPDGAQYETMYWHDGFTWTKDGRHYYAVSGTTGSKNIMSIVHPIIIMDVTDIRTSGVPTTGRFADVPSFEKTPVYYEGEWYPTSFYWHDVVVEGNYAYLNYEALWGVSQPSAAQQMWIDRVNDTGRVAIFNITGYDTNVSTKFPYVDILHSDRSVRKAAANGLTNAKSMEGYYIHNINVAKVDDKLYLVQADNYVGLSVYDISANPTNPPMIAFFDLNLYEDISPSLGLASDQGAEDPMTPNGVPEQWGTTLVPGKRMAMAWGHNGHYALRWTDPTDPVEADNMLRNDDAVLPRIKAPGMLYSMCEYDRSIHELEVEIINRELDVAVLKFKDSYSVPHPMTLGGVVGSTVGILGYDGTHNAIATTERAHVSKQAREEALIAVDKVYQERFNPSNLHNTNLLHDRVSAGLSNTDSNKQSGFNYLKRQMISTSGFEVKAALKGGMSGAPVVNAAGHVVGMVQSQYGDATGTSVSVMDAWVIEKALTNTTCPLLGITGMPANLQAMKLGGYVSSGMSSMSGATPTTAVPEMASGMDLMISLDVMSGYYVDSVHSSLPNNLVNSIITHVDDVAVSADATTLSSVLCGSHSGATHNLTYKVTNEMVDFGTFSVEGSEGSWTIINSLVSGTECVDVTVEYVGGSYDEENSYTLTSGTNTLQSENPQDGKTIFCLGATATLTGYDSWGDRWNGGYLKIYVEFEHRPAKAYTKTVTLRERASPSGIDYFYGGNMVL